MLVGGYEDKVVDVFAAEQARGDDNEELVREAEKGARTRSVGMTQHGSRCIEF